MEDNKCKTCGGKGVILNDCLALAHPEWEECPDCQALLEEARLMKEFCVDNVPDLIEEMEKDSRGE